MLKILKNYLIEFEFSKKDQNFSVSRFARKIMIINEVLLFERCSKQHNESVWVGSHFPKFSLHPVEPPPHNFQRSPVLFIHIPSTILHRLLFPTALRRQPLFIIIFGFFSQIVKNWSFYKFFFYFFFKQRAEEGGVFSKFLKLQKIFNTLWDTI